MNSVSLQVSLRQKYLLFWLMSENQKNTNVVKGLVENKLLAFPLEGGWRRETEPPTPPIKFAALFP